ncbi:hypothetical protein [Parvularcula sp. IMCC14364]|uniref:hypothetical protein n=1 Tax=Parvularcula sp. IMCC14364 TaxID=3067902 RepID=UPI0027421449|nr:hypothetical protein [Parvularcula sp. IMCC14364]
MSFIVQIEANDLDGICLLKPPIGPVRSKIDFAIVGIDTQVCQYSRKYDRMIWPHAKKGFFGLKKKIPEILAALEIHYT